MRIYLLIFINNKKILKLQKTIGLECCNDYHYRICFVCVYIGLMMPYRLQTIEIWNLE